MPSSAPLPGFASFVSGSFRLSSIARKLFSGTFTSIFAEMANFPSTAGKREKANHQSSLSGYEILQKRSQVTGYPSRVTAKPYGKFLDCCRFGRKTCQVRFVSPSNPQREQSPKLLLRAWQGPLPCRHGVVGSWNKLAGATL